MIPTRWRWAWLPLILFLPSVASTQAPDPLETGNNDVQTKGGASEKNDCNSWRSESPDLNIDSINQPWDRTANKYLSQLPNNSAAQIGGGAAVLGGAIESLVQVERNAKADTTNLSQAFIQNPNATPKTLDDVAVGLETSQKNLETMITTLDNTQSGLEQSERLRFRNTMINAYQKAEAAREIVFEAKKEESTLPLAPFKFLVPNAKRERKPRESRFIEIAKPTKRPRALASDLTANAPETDEPTSGQAPKAENVWSLPLGTMMQPVENPLSKSVLNGDQGARAELAQLFGADKPITKATTEDQLVNRQVFYWGLPQDRRDELAERIRLIETLKLKQKDGTEKTVPLLHNGYLMGGGDTAMDCSSFVSSVLPASVRKGSYTTLDFKAMYTLLRSGQIEVPPKYKKNREAWIRKVAQSFEALDLYDGAKPRQADLLVYRSEIAEAGNKGPAFGHVFLVEEFNSKRLQATVIEASQSATTLRRRPFDLSVTPMNKKVRPIRPGLMLLRLRNPGVQSCSVGGGKT